MKVEIKGNLDEHKMPYIDVQVAAPGSGDAFNARVVIDTGAAINCMQPGLIEAMGLQAFKQGMYNNPVMGNVPTGYYKADMKIGDTTITGVTFTVLHSPNYPAAIILGSAFLKYCTFVYDGPAGSFSLIFHGFNIE